MCHACRGFRHNIKTTNRVEQPSRLAIMRGEHMSSSFAASLRRLAEDAAEAKRVEMEKAKLAEKASRAEALRIQRLEEARVREAGRLALLQAEKDFSLTNSLY